MERDEPISRRRVLCLAGGGSAVALAAGCLGTDDADRGGAGIEADTPTDDSTGTEGEPTNEEGSSRSDGDRADNETAGEPVENESAEEPARNETDGESTDEEKAPQTDGTEHDETDAEDENGGGSAVDPNVDIVLKATTSGWEGTKPEAVAGETNPTLVLEAGAKYSITWENADGKPHNIEIWNEQEEVVGDHETELLAEEGKTQTIEFVATEEMVEYACEIHFDWGHRAPLEVVASE